MLKLFIGLVVAIVAGMVLFGAGMVICSILRALKLIDVRYYDDDNFDFEDEYEDLDFEDEYYNL